MAKILISFIGTGQLDKNNQATRSYKLAHYELNGQIYNESFIAKALFEHLKVDNLYLFGTMKSMWEEVYDKFASNKDESYWLELGTLAENANKESTPDSSKFKLLEDALPKNSKIFLLHYGLNEQELWANFEVFNKAFDFIDEGDELYLDITHAFRSLPMFALMSVFYLQDVIGKTINISGVYYGMLDVMSETNNIAKVVDLQPIVSMNKWIKSAQQFAQYGVSYNMLPLIEEKNVRNKLKDFSDFLQLNYINEVATQVSQLTTLQASFDSLPLPAQLVLRPTIKKFIQHFQNQVTLAKKQLALARWHYQNANYGMSYIVLVEAIISYVCECENLNLDNKNDRELAKDKLHKEKSYADLLKIYKPANEVRKKIAHSIPSKHSNKTTDIQGLGKYLSRLARFIK